MVPRPRPLSVAVAAMLAAGSLPAQNRKHPVGSMDAAVELANTWRRQKFNADLGPDQWVCIAPRNLLSTTRQVYVVLGEALGPVENEADLRRVLDRFCDHGHDAKIEIQQEARWTRAARAFDVVIDGLRLSFRCEVLARDGLAYHVTMWSLRGQQDWLDECAEDFRNGFTFPGADSGWQRGLSPKRHAVTAGDLQLSFALRPAVLRRAEPEDDERHKFASADDCQILQAFVVNGHDKLRDVVDAEASTLRRWDDTFTEVSRSDAALDGAVATTLVGATSGECIKVLVAPAGPRQWFLLRYRAPGAAGLARPEREALFASVQRSRIEGALALPPFADAPADAPANRLERFLAAARIVGRADGWALNGRQRLDDGSWVLWDWSHGYLVTPATAQRLAHEHSDGLRCVTRWRGDWLWVGREGRAYVVRDDERIEPPLCEASYVHAAGDDLLLLRTCGTRVPGVTSALDGRHDTQLIRRNAAGTETVVATLATAIDSLAVDAAHRVALLRGTADDDAGNEAAPPRLWTVDLASGAVAVFGDWREVSAVAPASDGWLVTGRPPDGPHGIWLVRANTAAEPLVTGLNLFGAGLAGDRLTFVTSDRRGGVHVLEAPLAACAAEGRHCLPFTTTGFQAVGRALVARLATSAPRTAAEIADARTAAVELAAGLGIPLPAGEVELDQFALAAAADPDHPLGAHGRILWNLLASAAAIERGARWVAADATDWLAWQARGAAVGDTAFATADNPCNLLVSCLDDGEDGRAPLAALFERTGGRVVLLGFDGPSLTAHAAALAPADFTAATSTGDVARLRAIFAAAPANHHLRAHAYARLGRAGQLRVVEELAAAHAALEPAVATDAVAWLAAWHQRLRTAADAEPFVPAALRAAQRLPREAAIYQLLGQACRLAFPDQPQKARQCFERVIALGSWGEWADAARRALADLGDH